MHTYEHPAFSAASDKIYINIYIYIAISTVVHRVGDKRFVAIIVNSTEGTTYSVGTGENVSDTFQLRWPLGGVPEAFLT